MKNKASSTLQHLSAYETHGIPVDGGYFAADLRAIARRIHISAYKSMNKLELINALNTHLDRHKAQS